MSAQLPLPLRVRPTPEVEAACRAFDEAVARGDYDAHGYTPAEAKAARKRGTYRAWNTEAA